MVFSHNTKILPIAVLILLTIDPITIAVADDDAVKMPKPQHSSVGIDGQTQATSGLRRW